MRACLREVRAWAADPTAQPEPPRARIAAAVRQSVRILAQENPGKSVELRVPPFVAVQLIDGPAHTRGTPPNVVETTPLVWLRLALGLDAPDTLVDNPRVTLSGNRAGKLAQLLPVATHLDC
nr:sterol carrier family protein [Corynebacterium mendelii]